MNKKFIKLKADLLREKRILQQPMMALSLRII